MVEAVTPAPPQTRRRGSRPEPLRVVVAILMVCGLLTALAGLYFFEIPEPNRTVAIMLLTVLATETRAIVSASFPNQQERRSGESDEPLGKIPKP